MITYLTIINTILIIYLLLKGNKSLYVTFKKEKTTWNNTLLGYSLVLWKRTSYNSASSIYILHFPVRNRRKTELREEVERLIKDKTNKRYTLHAKFSWLKTWKEVKQFEKDYSVVDREIVGTLVNNFVLKNNKYEK